MTLITFLADSAYRYIPFLKPAPVWSYWYLLSLPLCLIITVVYKSVRCQSMSRVPREAAQLFAFILLVMVASAAGLGFLVRFLEHLNN